MEYSAPGPQPAATRVAVAVAAASWQGFACVGEAVKESGAGVFAARPAKVTSENESTNEIPIRPGD